MKAQVDERTAVKNRILASLGRKQRRQLLPMLKPKSYSTREMVYDVDQPIDVVVFPLNGVFSMVSVSDGKETVEVATIGNEGLIGLPVFFQTQRIPLQVFSQVAGEALTMSARDFRKALRDSDGALADVLLRYTQVLFNQIAQSAACNAIHLLNERCARWLLMTHDRTGSDAFMLTQDFLAQMLGVRRASINEAVAALQKNNLISYKRGELRILDRKGLEAAACHHYYIIKKEYDRLF
ncbi:MAG TPA: Crp/Fnr family transcriptional regulator [Nitrospiraceae bacterium]|nr:Crp/Fnr family transcriptional regulator [Nitrospiraceae bacterium]